MPKKNPKVTEVINAIMEQLEKKEVYERSYLEVERGTLDTGDYGETYIKDARLTKRNFLLEDDVHRAINYVVFHFDNDS